MFRKIIDTQYDPVVVLELPESLQGKRIEVIAFAIDEMTEITKETVTMGDFFGTIAPGDAENLLQFSKQARSEWDRDF